MFFLGQVVEKCQKSSEGVSVPNIATNSAETFNTETHASKCFPQDFCPRGILTGMEQSVLFVPVSGPSGMGEFARTRAVADALVAAWPAVRPHFLLHREAPYAQGLRYPVIRLPKSP
ncbi:MAG: hypothetical protein RL469_431, partial [Pseudomonadota bacterium]